MKKIHWWDHNKIFIALGLSGLTQNPAFLNLPPEKMHVREDCEVVFSKGGEKWRSK